VFLSHSWASSCPDHAATEAAAAQHPLSRSSTSAIRHCARLKKRIDKRATGMSHRSAAELHVSGRSFPPAEPSRMRMRTFAPDAYISKQTACCRLWIKCSIQRTSRTRTPSKWRHHWIGQCLQPAMPCGVLLTLIPGARGLVQGFRRKPHPMPRRIVFGLHVSESTDCQ